MRIAADKSRQSSVIGGLPKPPVRLATWQARRRTILGTASLDAVQLTDIGLRSARMSRTPSTAMPGYVAGIRNGDHHHGVEFDGLQALAASAGGLWWRDVVQEFPLCSAENHSRQRSGWASRRRVFQHARAQIEILRART